MKLHDLYLEKLKRNPVPFHEVKFDQFSPIVREMIENDIAKEMKRFVDEEVKRRMHGSGPWPQEVPVGIRGMEE